MITYKFIKYLYTYIKYYKILNEVYREENLLENLSSLFKVEFKKDWIGRIYAVFNPHIQDGIFNQNNQILEYTNEGLINNSYIESYIMSQLNIAKQFIKANNLFDLLTYKLIKIDEHDNYLFIIQPITLEDCISYIKKFIVLWGVIGIFAICLIYLI
jgi:hypothetical protein